MQVLFSAQQTFTARSSIASATCFRLPLPQKVRTASNSFQAMTGVLAVTVHAVAVHEKPQRVACHFAWWCWLQLRMVQVSCAAASQRHVWTRSCLQHTAWSAKCQGLLKSTRPSFCFYAILSHTKVWSNTVKMIAQNKQTCFWLCAVLLSSQEALLQHDVHCDVGDDHHQFISVLQVVRRSHCQLCCQ